MRAATRAGRAVLAEDAVVAALLELIPADCASLNELDVVRGRADAPLMLVDDGVLDEPFGRFWDHFWDSAPCCYTETVGGLGLEVARPGDFHSDRQWHSTGMYTEVMRPAGVETELVVPLPSPPGISRRLVFFRGPGRPFTDDERDNAVLLQPHLARALAQQARRDAAEGLTERQVGILHLVAAGHDNAAIAHQLRLSRGTVRKHLENIAVRLDVTSRSAAAAKAFPDMTWS